MDAAIVVAMIVAFKELTISLIDKFAGVTSKEKLRSFAEQHYETLKDVCSENCMRILKQMEAGQLRRSEELLKQVYPEWTHFGACEQKRLLCEFEYRLLFLALAGLIKGPTKEYRITDLGKTFVTLARQRKDYFSILCD